MIEKPDILTSRNYPRSSTNSPSSEKISNPAEAPAQSLTTRHFDFWLMGGASVFVWLIFFALGSLRSVPAINQLYVNSAATAATLAIFVNYPHFMASYKIAYSRGYVFILKNWFQLLLVPALLVTVFTYAYFTFNEPNPLPKMLNPLGFARGEGLVALAVLLMYFTVGWHYTKQVYGCMLTYAVFDAYPLNSWQRRVLRWLLYSVWFVSYFSLWKGTPSATQFFGISTGALIRAPPVFHVLANILLQFLFVGVAYFIFVKNWRRYKKRPSANFLIPLIALMVWWYPLFFQSEFYFFFAALFHSLQYLPFVVRYETARNRDRKSWRWRGSALVVALVIAGFFSFELGPQLADEFVKTDGIKSAAFFMAAATLFLNIHHYFIDNVIWRFNQPQVRRYLFGQQSV